MNTRVNSSNSYGFFSVMSERSLPKKPKRKRLKSLLKIILIMILFVVILYIFIDYSNFNQNILSDDLYEGILKHYKNLYAYADVIDHLTNFHIFLIFFIFGFCLWNIYKSFIHILGFFITELIIFILKLIFRKKPKILGIDLKDIQLSPEAINSLCEFTSEYECPSYRAAYVVYSYMSFICLLFKEKKLRHRKMLKIGFKIFFSLICIFLNVSLIFLLQSTIGSILIGSGIGFIIYFFMFSLLKIDYDRSEQMKSILNFNIIFYFLINIGIIVIILFLYFFLDIDDGEKQEFMELCGTTFYKFKEMNLETIFKSLFFFCNLTMIICIKLQKKFILHSDGIFMSRNFNVEEITDENNLITQIKNEETLKFNTKHFVKYLCKVLICFGIALVAYLIYQIIKNFRDENYVIMSFLMYLIPTNFFIIFLFFFSKWIFISLDLEINSY